VSNLARLYTPPKGIRRLLFAIGLIGGLAWESAKAALRGNKPPKDFSFNDRDVFGEPPGVPSWGPGRWTKGGEA